MGYSVPAPTEHFCMQKQGPSLERTMEWQPSLLGCSHGWGQRLPFPALRGTAQNPGCAALPAQPSPDLTQPHGCSSKASPEPQLCPLPEGFVVKAGELINGPHLPGCEVPGEMRHVSFLLRHSQVSVTQYFHSGMTVLLPDCTKHSCFPHLVVAKLTSINHPALRTIPLRACQLQQADARHGQGNCHHFPCAGTSGSTKGASSVYTLFTSPSIFANKICK